MNTDTGCGCYWIQSGEVYLQEVLQAIRNAQDSVSLEVYHYAAEKPLDEVRSELVLAANRGARVRVLIDAWGSMMLESAYWTPLIEAGGEFRWFNPIRLGSAAFRNHRKILVCDRRVGFCGGFNMAPEYFRDPEAGGWRDLAVKVEGASAPLLEEAFDGSWKRADFRHRPLARLRKAKAGASLEKSPVRLLLSAPGRGNNQIRKSIVQDLKTAKRVWLSVAYFFPPWRLRKLFEKLARNGTEERFLLAAITDVPLMREASRSQYSRFLRAGIAIHEYQTSLLHTKCLILDEVVYLGSSNLDARSLRINYESMLRIHDRRFAEEGRAILEQDFRQSIRIDRKTWRQSRTFWDRLKGRFAGWFFSRVDPWMARWQLRNLR